jgi:hypothetical protein
MTIPAPESSIVPMPSKKNIVTRWLKCRLLLGNGSITTQAFTRQWLTYKSRNNRGAVEGSVFYYKYFQWTWPIETSDIPSSRSYVHFPLHRWLQRIWWGLKPCVTFCNMLDFYGEKVLAPIQLLRWRIISRQLSGAANSTYRQVLVTKTQSLDW